MCQYSLKLFKDTTDKIHYDVHCFHRLSFVRVRDAPCLQYQ